MPDGKVIIETGLDSSGIKKDVGNLEGDISSKANAILAVTSEIANAVGGVVEKSIQVGESFEASMSQVAAISGATGDELAILEQKAKEMGSSTQFTASQAADALQYMALAGWSAKESTEALDGVLNLAAASGMDLAQASDMVTDYMSAFGWQCKDSAKFADYWHMHRRTATQLR